MNLTITPFFVGLVCSTTFSVVLSAAVAFAQTEKAADAETTELQTTEKLPLPEPKAEPTQADEDQEGIEEIRVTAQKRGASLNDVPVAVSAFSGEDLFRAGIEMVDDLAFSIPNFHYGTNQGSARITIRGISTDGGDQSAAFHIDGVYQNSELAPAALTFFDIERIEVLRGPQGTLYGRNATGGSVNVISRKPTDEFELSGDVQMGTYNLIQTRGVLNVPLIDDQLATRFSFVQMRQFGYQSNLNYNLKSVNQDDRVTASVRGQLLYTPTEDLEMLLRATYISVGGRGYGLKSEGDFPDEILQSQVSAVGLGDISIYTPIFEEAVPNPTNPRHINMDYLGDTDGMTLMVNHTLTWDLPTIPVLGDSTLTAITAYATRDIFTAIDRDFSSVPAIHSETTIVADEYIAEAHLASSARNRFRWLLGGFFLRMDRQMDIAIPADLPFVIVFEDGTFGTIEDDVRQDVQQQEIANEQSLAAYGQVDFDVWDDFTISAGIRYSHDAKNIHAIDDEVNPAVDTGTLGEIDVCLTPGIDSDKKDSWQGVTGRVGVQYRFTSSHNAYASVSTGYKAGTIEQPVPAGGVRTSLACGDLVDIPNAEPEKIIAYEIGSKNTLFNRRLQANLTAFYYDYQNLQVTTFYELSSIVENAAEARLFGSELELLTQPVSGLEIGLSAAYLDAKFTSFPEGRMAENPAEVNDFSGNVLPRAPRYTVAVLAQYEWQWGAFGSLSPRVQYYASDKVYFRAANLPKGTQNAYQVLNARLLWRSSDYRYLVEAFINNALDVNVKSHVVIGSSLLGSPTQVAYEPPRTAGLRVGIEW